jgi:hypothetical protein
VWLGWGGSSSGNGLDYAGACYDQDSARFFHIRPIFEEEIVGILRRAGLVQLLSASSPSHQVLGLKPSLYRISAGIRLYFGYSFSQTSLMWEPLALGLPFLYCWHS